MTGTATAENHNALRRLVLVRDDQQYPDFTVRHVMVGWLSGEDHERARSLGLTPAVPAAAHDPRVKRAGLRRLPDRTGQRVNTTLTVARYHLTRPLLILTLPWALTF